jgi:hypothetical protein
VATHCETGDTGRFLRWHQGWTRAAELLGEGGTGGSLPNDLEPTVTQKVLLLTQGASDNNLWNEAQMQSTLAAFIAEASPDGAFFSKHTSDESCERVLQAAIQAHLIPTSNAFHCQRAWDKFATVSANAFATTPNSREHQPFDFAKVYLNPLL